MKNKTWSVLVSIAIAFGLWLYVINYVSPESTASISGIPVVFTGETALEERNLIITSDRDLTVSLELKGNRSDLNKVDKSNITVTVDLTKVYDPGDLKLDYNKSFPGTVSNNAFEVLSQYPGQISVTVEKRLSEEIPVKVVYTGAAPEGYITDTEAAVLDHPAINVSGPSSVVERIDHARIDVDLTERKESISENFRYTLCDAEGDPVDVVQVTTNVAEIHLDLKIRRFKEIPLELTVGYGAGASVSNTTIDIQPKSIRVSGSEAVLEEMEKIVLGTIDLATIEADTQMTFTINLPEGVTNLSEVSEATVNIQFKGLSTKEFTVSKIQAIHVPEGMDYDLLNEVLKVKLRGATNLINAIDAEDIVVTVDFTGKELGTFTIKPVITVKGDAYSSIGAVGSYSVSVTLKEAVVEEES